MQIQYKPLIAITVGLALVLQGCNSSEHEAIEPTAFFDDFSYENFNEMKTNGWKARTETGHPGVKGATWSAEGISFHQDPAEGHNRILRLTSQTDGTGKNTRHTQFCHARKYRDGTYAARVYFRNEPLSGPDGDEVIQTFYTISPLKAPMDPDYSEADFEYLPNGGWEQKELALFATTWETFQLEPWTKDNEYSVIIGDFSGWHILLLQLADNKVRYYVDGKLFAEHSSRVYPEEAMSINFNQWFTAEGVLDSTEMRVYQEDVDWVYHEPNTILNTAQVKARVAALRDQAIAFRDTVPVWEPPLPSPCGL